MMQFTPFQFTPVQFSSPNGSPANTNAFSIDTKQHILISPEITGLMTVHHDPHEYEIQINITKPGDAFSGSLRESLPLDWVFKASNIRLQRGVDSDITTVEWNLLIANTKIRAVCRFCVMTKISNVPMVCLYWELYPDIPYVPGAEEYHYSVKKLTESLRVGQSMPVHIARQVWTNLNEHGWKSETRSAPFSTDMSSMPCSP